LRGARDVLLDERQHPALIISQPRRYVTMSTSPDPLCPSAVKQRRSRWTVGGVLAILVLFVAGLAGLFMLPGRAYPTVAAAVAVSPHPAFTTRVEPWPAPAADAEEPGFEPPPTF
jgi:hypothetical protein